MKKPVAIFTVLIIGAASCYLIAWTLWPRAVPRASGPLPHHVYVWQRAWTPAVCEAVQNTGNGFSRLVVLAAEVSFRNNSPRIVRVPVDYRALQKSNLPTGIALRIGPYQGVFTSSAEATSLIANLAASLINRAREAGIDPAELQIDFDCAESKLDGYRVWVKTVREKISPIPVTITTLPCWLKHRGAFRRLVDATDGYVLQVHSFEKPKASDKLCLCDKEAAGKAVEKAARFEKPFMVALPTYGYIVAFDTRGKLLGITSEGSSGNRPAGARIESVRANPADMAELIRMWTRDRPANLTGIIWYRLPIATDRLNWKMTTLAAVMSGKTPEAKLVVRAHNLKPCLHEIELINNGLADACTSVSVSVRWSDARLVASDGLGGFQSASANTNELLLHSPKTSLSSALGPGDKIAIGWIRLSDNCEVKTNVQP